MSVRPKPVGVLVQVCANGLYHVQHITSWRELTTWFFLRESALRTRNSEGGTLAYWRFFEDEDAWAEVRGDLDRTRRAFEKAADDRDRAVSRALGASADAFADGWGADQRDAATIRALTRYVRDGLNQDDP